MFRCSSCFIVFVLMFLFGGLVVLECLFGGLNSLCVACWVSLSLLALLIGTFLGIS